MSKPKPKGWMVDTWALGHLEKNLGLGGGLLAALNSCSSSPQIKHWFLHQLYQELTLLCWQEIASPWARGAGRSSAQPLGGKSMMSLV